MAPTIARVVVEGDVRTRLRSSTGDQFKPGDLPPGSYTVYAFFEEAQPTKVLTLTLSAGETRTVTCNPEMKSCR